MKALLVIFLWNAGELAISTTEVSSIEACEATKVQIESTLNDSKYLKGFNRQAVVHCFPIETE